MRINFIKSASVLGILQGRGHKVVHLAVGLEKVIHTLTKHCNLIMTQISLFVSEKRILFSQLATLGRSWHRSTKRSFGCAFEAMFSSFLSPLHPLTISLSVGQLLWL